MTAFKSLSAAMIKGFLRDKMTLFFVFLFPLMFLVVFGLLFSDAGSDKTKIAAVGDGPVLSALEQTGALELEKYGDEATARQKVNDGDLPAAVVVNGDRVDVTFAASDQVAAGTVIGIVSGVVDKINLGAAQVTPKFTLEAKPVEDASLKPIQYLTPGILSWAISISGVFGAALTMVSWRKKQVLRRIRLAPVSAMTVLSSRVLVSVGTAVAQGIVFVAVAMLPLFGLKLTGQWYLALPLLVLGTTAFFAIGMLVGAFCKTEEAASGAANIIILPMAFLSGTFFPVENAPGWLQAVSNVFPLRHMNDGMLDVLVRGKGVEALLVPSAVLIGFTLVVGFLAVRLFRWED
ncbi:ABC-2 type transport system permease protein [Saccharothrix ecbatanensis]|jgi:ABC-2 type transport system permease protein|uniref:Transport permease protein n=1 Tax=Saccharothrix ecbatanensis TaxID=1105145 RepID=A0A7W9HNS8_9PSEU|nr:ABC transporter permease [Saccharothrix ecbatanensis]MBB5805535.1 ABC-2 type transport system permease protein [Saccharothrix ecbatanensis]